MFSPGVFKRAVQIVEDGIDVRHVMWELTTNNLDVSVNSVDQIFYREWIIGKRGRENSYDFAIRVEINNLGNFFTVTARSRYLRDGSSEELRERYDFRYEIGEGYVFNTDSPREVLNTLDRLIGYLEV